MTKINIFSENIHKNIEIDEKEAIITARKILNYYLKIPEIFNKSCLKGFDFDCISFDILYCNNKKTHEINKEYRKKDYPADIITFAVFADSEEKFIFDGEINLGEIIISLDKTLEKARGQEGKRASNSEPALNFENQLYFLISHGIMHLLGFDHQTNEDYNFIVASQNSALKEVRGEK